MNKNNFPICIKHLLRTSLFIKLFRITFIFTDLIILVFLTSCNNDYVPKPRGYFRIDLPKKNYTTLDSIFPYNFEYSVYSKIVHDKYAPKKPYWINIEYPKFKGNLHISYKTINGNLTQYLEDARNLAFKHIPKANEIEEHVILRPKANVYGLIYDIKGTAAASPYQFYLTDSTKNFFRGALYFNIKPNNDSLAPVIDYIEQDINHLIRTFKWKNK